MGAVLQFIAGRHSAVPASRTTSRALGPDADELLLMQAAKRELRDVAILTIITCGMINSFDRLDMWHLRRAQFRNIPPDPIVLPLAVSQLCDSGACLEAQTLFKALSEALTAAKQLLDATLAGAEYTSLVSKRDQLVAAWSEVASILLLCIYEIERIAEADSSIVEAPFEAICKSLISVKDGGVLLDKEDRWVAEVQRRTCRRIRVNLDATLRYRGGIRHVRVLDLSQGGMGLDFATGLAVDDIVSVELNNDRRFVGRVVWCTPGRAGIEFASQLAANDPLISAG